MDGAGTEQLEEKGEIVAMAMSGGQSPQAAPGSWRRRVTREARFARRGPRRPPQVSRRRPPQLARVAAGGHPAARRGRRANGGHHRRPPCRATRPARCRGPDRPRRQRRRLGAAGAASRRGLPELPRSHPARHPAIRRFTPRSRDLQVGPIAPVPPATSNGQRHGDRRRRDPEGEARRRSPGAPAPLPPSSSRP